MAGKSSAIRAGRAYYELGGQTDTLGVALRKAEGMVRKSVGGITTAYGGAKAILGKAGISAALGAASAALASLLPATALKRWAETGAELVNAAKRANTSAKALGSLGYAARQTGTDVGTMEGTLKGVRDKILDAARGSDEAQLAFARLNINFLALSRMKPDDQLRLIAQRLNSIQNPMLRAAYATDLLGNADLLPTLERLKEFESRAARLGTVLSDRDAASAKRFDESLVDLHEIIKSVGNAIAVKLAPQLDQFIDKAIEVSQKVRDWIAVNGDLEKLSEIAWTGIQAAWAEGTRFLGMNWEQFIAKAKATWVELKIEAQKAWTTIAHVGGKAIGTMVTLAKDVTEAVDEWLNPINELRDGLQAVIDVGKRAGRIIDAVSDSFEKMNPGNAWKGEGGDNGKNGIGLAGWAKPLLKQGAKHAALTAILGPTLSGIMDLSKVAAPLLPELPADEKKKPAKRGLFGALAAGMGFDDPELKKRLAGLDAEKAAGLAKIAGNNLPPGKAPEDLWEKMRKLLGELKKPGADQAGPRADATKNDLKRAAEGGIAQALINTKGIGAQDVRTKEGFASVAASLRQQSISQQQLYYTRRQTIALEKLGVLT